MTVCPDSKMTLPVAELVFWAAACVRRAAALIGLLQRDDSPALRRIAEREDQFVHAYRVVLQFRAAEVRRYCDQVGLTGCTAEMVRAQPFLVVLALDEYLHGRKEQ